MGRLPTIFLPDDTQDAGDPLHNNLGDARYVPALFQLSRSIQADWYVLADDDTYLFLGRLRKVLANFDPQESLFFGVPSRAPFGHCDAKGQCTVPVRIRGRTVCWRQTEDGPSRVSKCIDPRWCQAHS